MGDKFKILIFFICVGCIWYDGYKFGFIYEVVFLKYKKWNRGVKLYFCWGCYKKGE